MVVEEERVVGAIEVVDVSRALSPSKGLSR